MEITPDILCQEIDIEEVHFLESIGKGSFGVVYKAYWRGVTVAVKKVETESEVNAFHNEVQQLCRVEHENIICLYGTCTLNLYKCLVMEYADGGSLYHLLHNSPCTEYNLGHGISWLSQCAKAVSYLHSIQPRPLLHRDLKPPNLLLTKGAKILKVCDFGTACELSTNMTDNRGSAAWMAPEVFEGKVYTEKCDVYSWGIMLWEVLTRRVPFQDLGLAVRIMWAVHQRQRPPLIVGCPKVLETLMKRCWDHNQERRPRMEEVVEKVAFIGRFLKGADEPISNPPSDGSITDSYMSPSGGSSAGRTSRDVSEITTTSATSASDPQHHPPNPSHRHPPLTNSADPSRNPLNNSPHSPPHNAQENALRRPHNPNARNPNRVYDPMHPSQPHRKLLDPTQHSHDQDFDPAQPHSKDFDAHQPHSKNYDPMQPHSKNYDSAQPHSKNFDPAQQPHSKNYDAHQPHSKNYDPTSPHYPNQPHHSASDPSLTHLSDPSLHHNLSDPFLLHLNAGNALGSIGDRYAALSVSDPCQRRNPSHFNHDNSSSTLQDEDDSVCTSGSEGLYQIRGSSHSPYSTASSDDTLNVPLRPAPPPPSSHPKTSPSSPPYPKMSPSSQPSRSIHSPSQPTHPSHSKTSPSSPSYPKTTPSASIYSPSHPGHSPSLPAHPLSSPLLISIPNASPPNHPGITTAPQSHPSAISATSAPFAHPRLSPVHPGLSPPAHQQLGVVSGLSPNATPVKRRQNLSPADPDVQLRRRSAEVPGPRHQHQGHRRSSSYGTSDIILEGERKGAVSHPNPQDQPSQLQHPSASYPSLAAVTPPHSPHPRQQFYAAGLRIPQYHLDPSLRDPGGSLGGVENALKYPDFSALLPSPPSSSTRVTTPMSTAYPSYHPYPFYGPEPGGGNHNGESVSEGGGDGGGGGGPDEEELGEYWDLLETELRPVKPIPSCPQSQTIFTQHKELAGRYLVLQTEIFNLRQRKTTLEEQLSKAEKLDRMGSQRYTAKIRDLENKREQLRLSHSRLQQQLEQIKARQEQEQTQQQHLSLTPPP